MTKLIANIPPIQVFVDRKYLGDGDGVVEGRLVTVKSIKHRALYFEVFLIPSGALYDKVPIHALSWKKDAPEVPIEQLQYWDALGWDIVPIEKSFVSQMRVDIMNHNMSGRYLFTIDCYHSDPNEINTTLTLTPDEHKSYNFIKRDDGRFGLYPNNLLLFKDKSFTVDGAKPDFLRASKEYYYAENGGKHGATYRFNYQAENTDWEYYYKTHFPEVWENLQKGREIFEDELRKWKKSIKGVPSGPEHPFERFCPYGPMDISKFGDITNGQPPMQQNKSNNTIMENNKETNNNSASQLREESTRLNCLQLAASITRSAASLGLSEKQDDNNPDVIALAKRMLNFVKTGE